MTEFKISRRDLMIGTSALAAGSMFSTQVLSAAPPNNAEVLYWKGLSQLRLAANGQGSYDGVASSFREYLKLAPHGRFAAEVQSMLQALPGVDKRQ